MRFIELYEDSYKRPESDKHFDRNQLPQIRRNHVKDSPFNYKEGTLNLDKIKPVQSQRVQGLSKKAQDVFKNKEDRPFIIDKNNYLINGHHRYDAAHILGITKVKVLKIDADIEDVMKHFSHTASDTEVMKDSLKKSLAKKIKQRLDAEAGGGGGAGAGAGAGASAGGDGGSTSSSGDGGSADSGDTGSSDSAPTTSASVGSGFVGIGTYMPGAKPKKKKKKKNYGYGKGIYETIEAAQDMSALLKGIEADLKQREKDLKKLPNKSIYDENFADGKKEAFIRPNFAYEWDEAQRYPEFKKLGKDGWVELASKGKATTIVSAKDINNTDAADVDSFKTLDTQKQKRATAQLKSGKVEMPIVAVYSDGYKELVGGNTRLTAMMAKNGKATVWQFEVPDEILDENFADGKVKGKSRPGRVKKAGASCKGSVTSLRAKAKKYSGEKGKMYHWCANMKAGRNK